MCESTSFIPVKEFNLEDELESILRMIDEPIPIVIEKGKKYDIRKIELERATNLVNFCRGLLCGLKVGKK